MKTLFAAAGLAALLAAAAGVAAAQPQGPRITLYAGPSYQGEQRSYVTGVNNLADVGFNDRAQSLRVQGRWRVCEAASLRGRCAEVTGDIPNLSILGLTGSISSIEDLNRAGDRNGGFDRGAPLPTPGPGPNGGYLDRGPLQGRPSADAGPRGPYVPGGDFGGPSLDGRTASFFPRPEPGPYRTADEFCRRLGFAGSIYADDRGRGLRDVVCRR